jgi:hypothetical protein
MKKSIKSKTESKVHLLPEFSTKNNLPWVSIEKFKPKLGKPNPLASTRSSSRILLRWRYTEFSNDKWKYGMGRYFETEKNICGPWWKVEGITGAIEVSHFCIIAKP